MSRDYTVTTGTDTIHLANSLIVRVVVVAVAGTAAWVVGKSIVADLFEEAAAGLL